jgi:hypothetical protein
MFEDTTVELAHDEAVTLVRVLDWLALWLAVDDAGWKLLRAFVAAGTGVVPGMNPGIFQARRAAGIVECVTLYGARLAERVARAEAQAAAPPAQRG